MKPTSTQSKSFLILSSIAILGAAAVIAITSKYRFSSQGDMGSNEVNAITYDGTDREKPATPPAEEPKPTVDTSDWKEFKDAKYSLSFKYNPAWKVKSSEQQDGWYKIELDPGVRYDNIRVYVSEKGYYAMEGLPTQDEKIGDLNAKSVYDLLYGVKGSKYFYTFDLGASLSLQPQFQAMVKSAKLAVQ